MVPARLPRITYYFAHTYPRNRYDLKEKSFDDIGDPIFHPLTDNEQNETHHLLLACLITSFGLATLPLFRSYRFSTENERRAQLRQYRKFLSMIAAAEVYLVKLELQPLLLTAATWRWRQPVIIHFGLVITSCDRNFRTSSVIWLPAGLGVGAEN